MTTSPSPALFTERQSFLRHWWGLGLLIGTLLLLVPLLSAAGLPPGGWVGLGLLAGPFNFGLLALMRLSVRLDAVGLTYRFAPFVSRQLPWTQVRYAYVRRYAPLRDFGGWGIKGFDGNWLYNVVGRYGLQLVLHDGTRILLGTQRPEAVQQVLAELRIPGARAA